MLTPEEIGAVDRDRLSEVYTQWPEAIRRALKQPLHLPERREFGSLILGGMGGSGAACDIVADWARQRVAVPVAVVKDYHLPMSAGPDTLVLLVSVSGDTKEALGQLREAHERGCQAAAMASGGAMEKACAELGVPFNRIERLLVPRASLPGTVIVPARVLEGLGVVEGDHEFEGIDSEVERMLGKAAPSVGMGRNGSKKLAGRLYGRNVAVYAPPLLASIAQHFKASLNENAKIPVQVEVYPELFHNEVEGWAAARNRSLVLLRTEGESREVERRLRKLKAILRGLKVPVNQFVVGLGGLGAYLSWALFFDLASIYLAVLEGRVPAPPPILHRMRKL